MTEQEERTYVCVLCGRKRGVMDVLHGNHDPDEDGPRTCSDKWECHRETMERALAAERQLHEARTQLERTMRYAAKQEALHNSAKHEVEKHLQERNEAEAQLEELREKLERIADDIQRETTNLDWRTAGIYSSFVRALRDAALTHSTPPSDVD